jgi:hypothetical protein
MPNDEKQYEEQITNLHNEIKLLNIKISLMRDMFKANMAALTPIPDEVLDSHIARVMDLAQAQYDKDNHTEQ